MSSSLEFHTVNAFAITPHTGSQAAVVVFPPADPRAGDERYLAALASDFQWPATVFISPMEGGEEGTPKYSIRWFTQEGELPLCGHGTLAAAAVLFSEWPTSSSIHFEHPTQGRLEATLEGEDGRDSRLIGISLPISPATVSPDERQDLRKDLPAATGLEASDVIRVARYEWGGKSAVVQIDPEVDLKGLRVDAKALGAHNTVTILTQVVGIKDEAVQIRSRVFIPSVGLDEDTITGSAHSVLTGYYLSPDGGGHSTITALTRPADDSEPVGAAPPATATTKMSSSVTLDAVQLSRRGGAMRCSLVAGRARLVGRAYVTGGGRLSVFSEDQ